MPQQALIYRLNGDMNPLHSNPDVAKMAGFNRPILHGLCSYAIAGYSVVAEFHDHDPTRVNGVSGRFSSPIIPGQTLRTEMWKEADGIHFRTFADSQEKPAVDNGFVSTFKP